MTKKKTDSIRGAPPGYSPPYRNNVDPRPYFLAVCSIIWALSLYKLWGRSLNTILPVYLTIFAPILCISIYNEFKNSKTGFSSEGYLLWALACFTIAIAFTGIGFAVVDWYEKIPIEPTNKFIAITGIFALGTGGLLYLVRQKYRIFWGVTEIAAGMSIAMYRTFANGADMNKANPEYFIAILTAGIYLIVRGFDNIEQGRVIKEKKLKDDLAAKLKVIR